MIFSNIFSKCRMNYVILNSMSNLIFGSAEQE